MKILIVRHGDPDYEIDGLTAKGKREVALLTRRLVKEDIAKLYCSPLGRAKATAAPTLRELGIEAEYCDWLQEFSYARVRVPYQEGDRICWDIKPKYIETMPEIYSLDRWCEAEMIKNTDVPTAYDTVCREFDKVLESHGYERTGYSYKVTDSNNKTIVFVCHFGLASVLISHLLNCSPYSIWQNTCKAPTSVSVFYTEERDEGLASMRAQAIGDISHLYSGGEPVSFAARFCECFSDETRH